MNIERAEGDPFDRRAALESALLLTIFIFILWLAIGCGSVPLEVCMTHPRYGAVCVTFSGGHVVKITGNFQPEDEEDARRWAEENHP